MNRSQKTIIEQKVDPQDAGSIDCLNMVRRRKVLVLKLSTFIFIIYVIYALWIHHSLNIQNEVPVVLDFEPTIFKSNSVDTKHSSEKSFEIIGNRTGDVDVSFMNGSSSYSRTTAKKKTPWRILCK